MSDKAELERRLVESYVKLKDVFAKGRELDIPWFIRQRGEDEAMLRFNEAAIALADAIRDQENDHAE